MRNKILTDLFTSKEFNNCISKMQPVNLQEDLKAEVGLILCELPESKIIELAEKNELKFFTVRIVLNMIKSFNSPFYKKFRKHEKYFFLPIEETTGYEDVNNANAPLFTKTSLTVSEFGALEDYDHKPDLALAEIDNLYWYDKEMLMLYLKHGNYRAIEEETGIPWESAYKSIQKSCKEIRLKVSQA